MRILVLVVLGTLWAASVRYRALADDGPVATELDAGGGWLNTDRPLRFDAGLRGHVVLLDFWTSGCINCIHALPDLEYLEKKYADEPFVVIGVHSGKFTNENERETVRNAMFRYGITHPVVLDHQMRLWNAYGIRAWPSYVLVGADGKLAPVANQFGTPLFTLSGEGRRETLDRAVAAALDEARSRGTLASTRVRISADRSVPSASGLAFPGKVIAGAPRGDAPGYVFIADSSHHRVVVATWPDDEAKSRLVWVIGSVEPGLADGDVRTARFRHPQGLAFDASRRVLYVADRENHAIRTVDIGALERDGPSAAEVVRTALGDGVQSSDRDAGMGGRAQRLSSPWDVVLADEGKTLYIAMAGTHQIWKMDAANARAAVVAGSGREDLVDGPARDAALAQPSGLALSEDGARLYFADAEASAVREVDLREGVVRTIVGRGLFDFGNVANTIARSRFQHCAGIAVRPVEGGEEIIVADTFNHKVRVIDAPRGRVRELLGVGRMQDAKAATDLVLDEPGGVALAGGRLFVADTNNHRIVVADPATGSWRELVIDGLGSDELEIGCQGPPVAPIVIHAKPGAPLRLRITPPLTDGAGVNPEAPTSVVVWDAAGALLMQRTLRVAEFPVSVEVPAASVKAGAMVTVRVRFAECTHGDFGVCTPSEYTVSVSIEASESTEAHIP